MGLIWTMVLNAGLACGAYWVARFGLRQPSGMPRTLAAGVIGWAWLTVGLQVFGTLGFLARGPLLAWVGVGLLIGLGCRRWSRDAPGVGLARIEAGAWTWEEVASLGLVLWASSVHAFPALLRPVEVVSDGPIYHLYFAARWWKAQRLALIATPFGESAAPYFPAGGDLWFTWLMVGWGGDRLARIGQAPFLALAGLTTLALCRRLAAGRAASAVATSWALTATPLFLFSFVPIVDTIFVAGYLLAAYFFLRHAAGDDGPSALALGALAAGCALGTKAPAVVFVPPLLALGAASALLRGGRGVARVRGIATVALVPFSVAGFWYARNAALTGNPLYPLHLAGFGRVWLAGWYGPGVMRLSPYYMAVHDWRALIDTLLAVLDPRLAPVWLAAVAGVWAWKGERRSSLDRWVWTASAMAAANVALYWLLIPYRTQQRFLFQALGLAAVPLARTFDRGRWLRAVGVGLLAVHLLTPQSWPFSAGEPPWDWSPLVPNAVGGLIALTASDLPLLLALLRIALLCGLGLAAFLAAWTWARAAAGPSPRRLAWATAATGALLAGGAAAYYPWGADDRQQFFPPYPDYVRGWLTLDLRAGPGGARVAYAGTNLPYYLMGVGLRNEVRYVNVDAHPGWLLHDYHRAARAGRAQAATWPRPRPGWDRVHPNYDAWLANLRAEDVRFLVVTRVNPEEGRHNVADGDGFPVERQWADAHPEAFVPVYGSPRDDPLFRLYRLFSPGDRAFHAHPTAPAKNLEKKIGNSTDHHPGPH